jgi:hypothetical protein
VVAKPAAFPNFLGAWIRLICVITRSWRSKFQRHIKTPIANFILAWIAIPRTFGSGRSVALLESTPITGFAITGDFLNNQKTIFSGKMLQTFCINLKQLGILMNR